MAWTAGLALFVLVAGGINLTLSADGLAALAPSAPPPEPAAGIVTEVTLEAAPEADPAPPEPSATDAAETPPDAADTPPEPVPVETEVYEVPEPPPITEAMEFVEPRPEPKPRPQPRATTPPAPPNRPAAAAAPSTARSGGAAGGQPGGVRGGMTGGTGTKPAASGVPGGKGRMPQPPYPSFARTRGLQGTVVLAISAGADGSVTGVSVARSCGHAELDRYACSWIRSRWRLPAGSTSATQTINFRLR